MDADTAYRLYRWQVDCARKKQVPHELSFHAWCVMWGTDIERRGKRKGDLYMQRIAPGMGYVPGNLRIVARQ